jgi:hypothetical protein
MNDLKTIILLSVVPCIEFSPGFEYGFQDRLSDFLVIFLSYVG